jgi:WhiB family redox-sensing transcriptional regulator
MDAAVCASVDPDLFFPEKGGPAARAIKMCSSCPVKAECLADALTLPVTEDFGVRGGTTAFERVRILRKERNRTT